MTTRGFYSVVQNRDREDYVIIRARSRADLERLVELFEHRIFPSERIEDTPEADYPARIHLHRAAWEPLAQRLAAEVDYPNFKDAVKERMPDGDYRSGVYLRVWGVLHAIEREGRPPEDGFDDDQLGFFVSRDG